MLWSTGFHPYCKQKAQGLQEQAEKSQGKRIKKLEKIRAAH
jgi:hypothetical protein